MNIHPRHLRMFLALAESLNFSKTAEQLFMTQPSLSKAIRDLEAALGQGSCHVLSIRQEGRVEVCE